VLPNEAAKKAYIIRVAEKMNANAQNAMLKVLEEPPGHAVLILTAENPSELLPTVRSRCVELVLSPARAALPEKAEARALELLDAVAAGPLETARLTFTWDRLSRQELAELLDAAVAVCAGRLRLALTGGEAPIPAQRLAHIVASLERARVFLERSVGVGHVAGYLCAELCRRPPYRNEE
jgi:DNA polymerase III delta prime subunit